MLSSSRWSHDLSPTRRPGWSAARSATSCSAGRHSTSTSSAASPSGPRVRSSPGTATRSSRSTSSSAPGGSCSTGAGRSTSRRSGASRSRPISPPATSPRTRSRCRCAGGDYLDPFDGRADIARKALRAVSDDVFDDDPLRLLRAVRLEDELGFRLDPAAEELLRVEGRARHRAAGERILDELRRLSADGIERLGGARAARAARRAPRPEAARLRLAVVPARGHVRREPEAVADRGRPAPLRRDHAPRGGAGRRVAAVDPSLPPRDRAVRARGARLRRGDRALGARSSRPARPSRREPLLRGDELGIEPGPEVGRLLELIAEERAAGTISTREEALELVRRSLE